MNKRTPQGYIIKIPSSRMSLFNDSGREFFAEPVPDFKHKRGSPLIVFISTDEGSISSIASGRAGIRAGTGLRRLNLENITDLVVPLETKSILEHTPAKVRKHVEDRLANGGILPPESFNGLVASVINLDPTSKKVLWRFSEARENAIKHLAPEAIVPLALQKEALGTALYLADLERNPLLEWSPKSSQQTSFLDGLPQAYLREDQMIINDLNQMPGFEKIRESITGTARFENESVRLDIILANRMRLEEQTGADLIYYNATYKSFVMVQYKAMENSGDDGNYPVFRIPNSQLTDEIKRMDELLKQLDAIKHPTDRDGYRINTNPFFIKICRRIVLEPDSISLTPGMYFSLDHWKILETEKDLLGSRGGRLISYGNIGRYLNNEEFANLVQKAWIGTTPPQSAVLEEIISTLLTQGKAVIIATKSQKEKPLEEEF